MGKIGSASVKAKVRTSSLYHKARHPSIARHICLRNPTCAGKSVYWLGQEWGKAKRKGNRKRMKLLKQTAVNAANIAKVAKDNKRLSRKEQKEFAKIHQLYRNWYQGKILPTKR